MYTVVRVGVPWAYLQLMEVLTQDVEVEITPLDPGLINLAALLVAVGSTATVIRGFWGRRQSTEAWAKGAEGERRTAHTLHRLGSRYRVVHDLPMPRGGNIDHVVVGPTGVFTIETKHYSADVVISRHGVRAGRASMHRVVDQAQRQARAMSAWLGTDATPIVVIQGSAVRLSGWFTQPFVDGVRFCSGPKLR